jgi:hypothetical protein
MRKTIDSIIQKEIPKDLKLQFRDFAYPMYGAMRYFYRYIKTDRETGYRDPHFLSKSLGLAVWHGFYFASIATPLATLYLSK